MGSSSCVEASPKSASGSVINKGNNQKRSQRSSMFLRPPFSVSQHRDGGAYLLSVATFYLRRPQRRAATNYGLIWLADLCSGPTLNPRILDHLNLWKGFFLPGDATAHVGTSPVAHPAKMCNLPPCATWSNAFNTRPPIVGYPGRRFKPSPGRHKSANQAAIDIAAVFWGRDESKTAMERR